MGRENQSFSDKSRLDTSALDRPKRKQLPRNKFLFIQIKDKKITRILSELKSELSPKKSSSTNIHITVNGPKKIFRNKDLEERIKKYKKEHPYITIGGVGRFFNSDVYVIYMKADCGDLREYNLWEKPDYKNSYNPHITIYEGRDQKMADNAYERIKSLDKKYKCADYEFLVHTVAQSDLNPWF
uniref:2'-5' RNA ligase superfamily protein n=1 Tax=Candidatus Kentrum sp. LPFa TaxID=2126335 RepID=A0A450VXG2_9GAMM|nr:MAG: 2'-5' RNA ligase superfamily protein [Candidatus Kentron sp. LPFa]